MVRFTLDNGAVIECQFLREYPYFEAHVKGKGVVVTHIPTGWTVFSDNWPFGTKNGNEPRRA